MKGYIVTREGKKIDINIPVKEDEYINCFQQVGLYSSDVGLIKQYMATIERSSEIPPTSFKAEFEFVAESVYDHYPTEEELLYFMSRNGMSRFDVVSISECFVLDFKE